MKLSIVENGKKRESAIDISRFASEIKKNSWKILLSGIIAGAIAWPLMSLMPSKYVSTATVLLKAQPDNVTPFQKVEGYDSTRNGYYETQNALMQSRVGERRGVWVGAGGSHHEAGPKSSVQR